MQDSVAVMIHMAAFYCVWCYCCGKKHPKKGPHAVTEGSPYLKRSIKQSIEKEPSKDVDSSAAPNDNEGALKVPINPKGHVSPDFYIPYIDADADDLRRASSIGSAGRLRKKIFGSKKKLSRPSSPDAVSSEYPYEVHFKESGKLLASGESTPGESKKPSDSSVGQFLKKKFSSGKGDQKSPAKSLKSVNSVKSSDFVPILEKARRNEQDVEDLRRSFLERQSETESLSPTDEKLFSLKKDTSPTFESDLRLTTLDDVTEQLRHVGDSLLNDENFKQRISAVLQIESPDSGLESEDNLNGKFTSQYSPYSQGAVSALYSYPNTSSEISKQTLNKSPLSDYDRSKINPADSPVVTTTIVHLVTTTLTEVQKQFSGTWKEFEVVKTRRIPSLKTDDNIGEDSNSDDLKDLHVTVQSEQGEAGKLVDEFSEIVSKPHDLRVKEEYLTNLSHMLMEDCREFHMENEECKFSRASHDTTCAQYVPLKAAPTVPLLQYEKDNLTAVPLEIESVSIRETGRSGKIIRDEKSTSYSCAFETQIQSSEQFNKFLPDDKQASTSDNNATPHSQSQISNWDQVAPSTSRDPFQTTAASSDSILQENVFRREHFRNVEVDAFDQNNNNRDNVPLDQNANLVFAPEVSRPIEHGNVLTYQTDRTVDNWQPTQASSSNALRMNSSDFATHLPESSVKHVTDIHIRQQSYVDSWDSPVTVHKIYTIEEHKMVQHPPVTEQQHLGQTLYSDSGKAVSPSDLVNRINFESHVVVNVTGLDHPKHLESKAADMSAHESKQDKLKKKKKKKGKKEKITAHDKDSLTLGVSKDGYSADLSEDSPDKEHTNMPGDSSEDNSIGDSKRSSVSASDDSTMKMEDINKIRAHEASAFAHQYFEKDKTMKNSRQFPESAERANRMSPNFMNSNESVVKTANTPPFSSGIPFMLQRHNDGLDNNLSQNIFASNQNSAEVVKSESLLNLSLNRSEPLCDLEVNVPEFKKVRTPSFIPMDTNKDDSKKARSKRGSKPAKTNNESKCQAPDTSSPISAGAMSPEMYHDAKSEFTKSPDSGLDYSIAAVGIEMGNQSGLTSQSEDYLSDECNFEADLANVGPVNNITVKLPKTLSDFDIVQSLVKEQEDKMPSIRFEQKTTTQFDVKNTQIKETVDCTIVESPNQVTQKFTSSDGLTTVESEADILVKSLQKENEQLKLKIKDFTQPQERAVLNLSKSTAQKETSGDKQELQSPVSTSGGSSELVTPESSANQWLDDSLKLMLDEQKQRESLLTSQSIVQSSIFSTESSLPESTMKQTDSSSTDAKLPTDSNFADNEKTQREMPINGSGKKNGKKKQKKKKNGLQHQKSTDSEENESVKSEQKPQSKTTVSEIVFTQEESYHIQFKKENEISNAPKENSMNPGSEESGGSAEGKKAKKKNGKKSKMEKVPEGVAVTTSQRKPQTTSAPTL